MESVLIPVVVFALFFGGAIWLGLQQQKKARALLSGLAARQALDLVETKSSFGVREVSVVGRQAGRLVRFWAFTTGSGKSRQQWVAVGVEPRQTNDLTFRLQAQGFGTKVAEMFGAKEVQVGDPSFGEKWFVRTNQPESFAAALVPEIRTKLTAARDRGARGEFKLEEGFVVYVQHGFLASEKTVALLEGVLPVLHDLSDAVEVCAEAG